VYVSTRIFHEKRISTVDIYSGERDHVHMKKSVHMRFDIETLAALDAWCEKQAARPNRSAAINAAVVAMIFGKTPEGRARPTRTSKTESVDV
jgi:hypothetical protein